MLRSHPRGKLIIEKCCERRSHSRHSRAKAQSVKANVDRARAENFLEIKVTRRIKSRAEAPRGSITSADWLNYLTGNSDSSFPDARLCSSSGYCAVSYFVLPYAKPPLMTR